MVVAKKKPKKEKMKDTETDTHIIYCILKQMKQKNKNIVDEKCIQDDVVSAFNEEDKKKESVSNAKCVKHFQ